MHAPSRPPATLQARAPGAFGLALSAAILVVIVAGFQYTIADALVRSSPRPPILLYVHALVAGTWIPFVVLQSALVFARRPRWHRRLGLWGMAHGALVPITGRASAVVMAHWHFVQGDPGAAASFPIPVNDALGFSVVSVLPWPGDAGRRRTRG